ncbi:MAG: hypothetical protein Tp1111DCM511881_17 [Prokaryotic dsDNA virus sp.]|nr:MAG: hypothetical protein Tp1111DCM511881_17 [Prokaryotic dsDNA virus sp.]
MRTQDTEQPSHKHPFRANRYPGFCKRCMSAVKAQEGALMGRDQQTGKWQVVHAGCTTEEEWEGAANDNYSRRDW